MGLYNDLNHPCDSCSPTQPSNPLSAPHLTVAKGTPPPVKSQSNITRPHDTHATYLRSDVVRHVNGSLTDHTAVNNATRRFRRGLEWNWGSSQGYPNAISSSLTERPLPKPRPLSDNPCAAYALKQYPEIFKIVSPIDVPMFKHLLTDHPNRLFVDSVIRGLTHGFRPLCNMPSPDTVDNTNHSICLEHPGALISTRDKEVAAGRYSPPFYHLLPGMKVSPLLLASDAGSSKLRLCTDMSYGTPSLNDLVHKEDARVAYNSLASFGPYMTDVPRGSGHLVLWKSDVARAYRNLPMCLQWQLQQVIKIDNLYYVDQCTNFGSAASPNIWCSIFSLVLWIAITKMGISRVNNLMDDTWGVAHSSLLVSFRNALMPLDQARFLLLFDQLRLPWEWKKQPSGPQLDIIVHYVDAESMSFSLTP